MRNNVALGHGWTRERRGGGAGGKRRLDVTQRVSSWVICRILGNEKEAFGILCVKGRLHLRN